jgi:hypothetical protein
MMRNDHSCRFRRPLGAFVLGGLLCMTRAASASEPYPGKIQETLGLECAPACTICHRDLLGGRNTVTQPFGKAIRGTAFLECCNPDLIPDALGALSSGSCTPSPGGVPQQGNCDSDGDGVTDIDELIAGRDPNPGGVEFCAGPKYGCGAHIAPAESRIDWFSLLMAGATAAVLVRKVRRSRKPR